MTPGAIFAELVRLQDDYAAKEIAARMKKATSPQAIARDAALKAYEDFKRGLVTDFRIMLAAVSESRVGLDEITRAVVQDLADRLNFEAVASQAHYANVKAAECRMEAEQLRREVEELRRTVEKMQYEAESRLKLVG